MSMANSIILGGGCFWCIEAVFSGVRGVISTKSGYSGGHTSHPTYQEVCAKNTGHAEVVLVEYDDTSINLQTILQIFFAAHNPTQLNHQGDDVGPQYRSCIFLMDETNMTHVEKSMTAAELLWDRPLTTTVETLDKFWPAEAEHDDYFALHSQQPYCATVISPKVAKVRASFSELYES